MTNKKLANRESEAHANKNRPARIPMSSGNRLDVPEYLKEEGYKYYWQLDSKGAVEQMKRAYWELVTNERNENITVPAGNGELLHLMRIEQKYYDEDMKTQQDRNNLSSTNQAQKLGDNEYVPMGRNDVAQKEREII